MHQKVRSIDLICLLCISVILSVLKWPAFERYLEVRYHLTLPFSASEYALDLEALSINTQNQIKLFVSRLDRAAVFGLQELFEDRVSLLEAQINEQSEQLKQVQSNLVILRQMHNNSNLLEKSNNSNKLGSKKGKTVSSTLTEVPAIGKPTAFSAEYSKMPTLPISAGDRVLFAGDSLMQGVAPHVISALRKQIPSLYALDLSRQSTGLAYPGFFNWPKTIEQAIALHNVNTVFMYIGANDFYDMNVNGKHFTVGSEAWQLAYTQVVQSLLKLAHSRGVRIVWVEMPPMDKPILRERVDIINGAYLKAIQAEKARWLTVKDVMSDTQGKYAKFLPNERGALVQVRLDDGVHFTLEGQRRLAKKVMSSIEFQP